MGQEPGRRSKSVSSKIRFLWRKTGNKKCAPDHQPFGWKLHRTNERSRPLARKAATFQNGLYAEQRQRTSVRIFCSAPACLRSHHGSGKTAQTNHAAFDDHWNTNDWHRQFLDEPVLPTAQRNYSFYMAAGLARCEKIIAFDWRKTRSIQCKTALGETFYHATC